MLSGVHQAEVAVTPRCKGSAAVATLDAEWPGQRQLAQHIGPESGIPPSRSEVAALGLHIACLPGLTAGQLGEAGSHFGPAVLVQRFSGCNVTVRQSRGESD